MMRATLTSKPRQRGVTMLVVMVLLSVMLLGALALARMTEVSTLAAGNSQYRNASLQASEIGLNTAFTQLQLLAPTAEDADAGNWYKSRNQAQDASGLPTIDWTPAPEIVVGAYRVKYVVERLCTVAVVADPLSECLVKAQKSPASASDPPSELPPINSRQYRATIRVTGPKDTTTFVQSLLTKG
jgi:Tfp pilus assembly protein PilX